MASQPINSQYNAPIVVSVLLNDVDTAGGMASIQNGTGVDLMITNCVLNVGTVATGACAVDAGVTSVSATTSIDNLLDGIDIHTATGSFGAASGDATNALLQVRWPAGKWVTCSKASGASAGAVASLYLTCIPIVSGG